MSSRSEENLRIVYILYMVGAFFGAIMFVGVILAYIERGKITDRWLESHVEKQIRIFWIWLIVLVVLVVGTIAVVFPSVFALSSGDFPVGVVAGLGVLFAISLLIPLGLFLYVLITSIQSLKCLDRGESIESF
ncbi:MAG: hypothetical protein F4X56_07090 [Gammaproteobacteria bacterium]|nr:hypothetical protein [Gammaproteobacteria bacterium]MYC25664.1 hypothetical protein [Gammaproteobacteria bacterium]